jgi:hypothetical protein
MMPTVGGALRRGRQWRELPGGLEEGAFELRSSSRWSSAKVKAYGRPGAGEVRGPRARARSALRKGLLPRRIEYNYRL